MVCFLIWYVANISSISPSSELSRVVASSVCSDKGLTLETSATHHIPQAKNIPYQPLLIKPVLEILLTNRVTAATDLAFISSNLFPSAFDELLISTVTAHLTSLTFTISIHVVALSPHTLLQHWIRGLSRAFSLINCLKLSCLEEWITLKLSQVKVQVFAFQIPRQLLVSCFQGVSTTKV